MKVDELPRVEGGGLFGYKRAFPPKEGMEEAISAKTVGASRDSILLLGGIMRTGTNPVCRALVDIDWMGWWSGWV